MERCANCGRELGNLEVTHVHFDNTVCFECKQKLDKQAQDAPEDSALIAKLKADLQRAEDVLAKLTLTKDERVFVHEVAAKLMEITYKRWEKRDRSAQLRPKCIPAVFAYLLAQHDDMGLELKSDDRRI